MPKTASPRVHEDEKFSLPLFFLTLVLSLAAFIGALRLLAPAGVWQAQVHAAAWAVAVGFFGLTLANCFVEYFFHRYVLHKPAIPLLSRFYKQHTKHHNLTRIVRRKTSGGHEVPFVENRFPIVVAAQGEASFFPWYTLAIFGLLLTPFLVLLQWALPA